MTALRLKIITVIILAVCLIVLSYALVPVINDSILKNADLNINIIELSIENALIHCYAIEGEYPQTIDYLIDNYGLNLQEDGYFYYYEFTSPNFKPVVKVLEK